MPLEQLEMDLPRETWVRFLRTRETEVRMEMGERHQRGAFSIKNRAPDQAILLRLRLVVKGPLRLMVAGCDRLHPELTLFLSPRERVNGAVLMPPPAVAQPAGMGGFLLISVIPLPPNITRDAFDGGTVGTAFSEGGLCLPIIPDIPDLSLSLD